MAWFKKQKKILDKYKLQLCSAKAKKSQSRRYNLYAAHKLEKHMLLELIREFRVNKKEESCKFK